MRVSNPSIKRIDVNHFRGLTDIHLETPELTSFRLVATEEVPSIWMKDPRPRNCKARLQIQFVWESQPDWSRKLRELLTRSSKYFKTLLLEAEVPNFRFELRREEDMNHKDQWLASLACNSRQLILSHDYTLSVSSIQRELPLPPEIDTGDGINGLLLIPHPKTIVMVAGLSGDDFLQVFVEKIGERAGNSRPCDSTGYRECWQNGLLSEAKIEIITRSNYKKAYPGI